jgi:hypothetical protein
MADFKELEAIARANGYWHKIEPWAARVAELEARLQAVIDVCPSLPPHAARRVIHVMARPSASAGTSPE